MEILNPDQILFQFICPGCGMAFTAKSSLKRHLEGRCPKKASLKDSMVFQELVMLPPILENERSDVVVDDPGVCYNNDVPMIVDSITDVTKDPAASNDNVPMMIDTNAEVTGFDDQLSEGTFLPIKHK